ncbi:hypothetical protein L1987_54263 [Smallanthus sonchifolius]|uniref:Uncharacterized protein n=1 Tax=Smallanthus sonchifolius TaxID=185202 RepID=A0ACB9E671_9ASTR|nr:hypothetical protein L1987_54263 [Smallanthus sonchifolius]
MGHRQFQAQFQTSGKQVLQEALSLSIEASVVPAFEISCKTMFDQVDATFHKGMIEHTIAAQSGTKETYWMVADDTMKCLQRLKLFIQGTVNSASYLSQTLSSELADTQRKLTDVAVDVANSKSANPLISQLSNEPLGVFHEKIKAPVDPTKELYRLAYEHKYEEAFTAALQRSNVLMFISFPGI